jgi:beta-aspartyl-peptidase (threonine type)
MACVVVHGGAWAIPDSLVDASVKGVKLAADTAWTVLSSNGSALTAVEAAVRCLEDNPAFDAGKGSVLNEDGKVEMDAILMDGKDLRCGAVACVSGVPNPITLARLVMEKTDHVMLVGAGAERLWDDAGLERVSDTSLVTEEAKQEFHRFNRFNKAVSTLFNRQLSDNECKVPADGTGHETVGAVAVDSKGNVACATSTGGITGKLVGRVGDTPIIGAGAYCDNNVGAASTTGHGESIMKVTLARKALWLIEQKKSPQEASHEVLTDMLTKVGGCGGIIIVTPEGRIGIHFTTKRMAWALRSEQQRTSGIDPKDLTTQTM